MAPSSPPRRYGEIGIDDGLVLDTKEELYEMNNGCVCCTGEKQTVAFGFGSPNLYQQKTPPLKKLKNSDSVLCSAPIAVRGDLIRILNRLLKRKSKLDAILIETTGLADPAPVAQTFFVDEDLKDSLRLDAIICVVDAKHISFHLDEEKPDDVVNESVQQIAFADKILLNKTDLISSKEKEDVIDRISAINRAAKILECDHARVPLDAILAQHAFDLDKIMAADPEFLQLEGAPHVHDENDCDQCAAGDKDNHTHHHHHDHDHQGENGGCAVCAAGDHLSTQHGQHGHKHKHKHDSRVSSIGIVLQGM